MNTPSQLAKHIKEVHFGGNWTWVNLKDTLAGITWQQATTQVHSLNTIVRLVYHINYYTSVINQVLQGEQPDAHDKYSFDHPPVQSEEDWQKMRDKLFADAEILVALVEQLSDSKMDEIFMAEKYGSYYRNILGVIEHTHYHLGQIALVKKMVMVQEHE